MRTQRAIRLNALKQRRAFQGLKRLIENTGKVMSDFGIQTEKRLFDFGKTDEQALILDLTFTGESQDFPSTVGWVICTFCKTKLNDTFNAMGGQLMCFIQRFGYVGERSLTFITYVQHGRHSSGRNGYAGLSQKVVTLERNQVHQP